MHDPTLIATIAAAFTSAWLFGLLTQRLGLSPIVGYIIGGVLIGPYTPGFIGDIHVAQQLAEVGVILLMFGVGLHFHLKDLLAVKGVAIPGALGQSLFATLLAIVIFTAFGISWKAGAVIGMAMAVASTVVLMRVLMDADLLNTVQGHVAVGWLIVEDVFTVILLVLIPVMGSPIGADAAAQTAAPQSIWITFGLALLKLGALAAIVLVAGSRIVPWVMVKVARLRSRELFTLTVLVFSVAIAAGSYYFFGASMALGAFLAGMVVAQSPVSHQAAADALPMRDAFAVLFFVSVGMLFDPGFVLREPLMLLAALGIIFLAKPLAALAIVAILGHPVRTALTVAVGLAQIGEFSFILSDLARQHGLMPDAGHNLLVAAAILSITVNPLIFRALPRIELWLKQQPTLWKLLNGRAERHAASSNQVAERQIAEAAVDHSRLAIVVGYGPVGRSVHQLLREAGLSTVVIDLNMETVSSLMSQGQTAIFGDASHESILEQAGLKRASSLVLTLPDASERAAIVATARSLNAKERILVRARYLREREALEQAGANAAVFEEAESAVALARLVLAETGLHRDAANQKIKQLRLQLITENISNISSQRVRSVMVPWSRVRWLPATAAISEVLNQVSRARYSRWPVLEPVSGRALGYLFTKDLIANAAEANWSRLIRPLQSITPDVTIETALTRMQGEGASLYLIVDNDRPVGLITLEDILEQVFGQIEDEYPHEPPVSIRDAVSRGGIRLDLAATTAAEAIRELADAIPANTLPTDIDRQQIVQQALHRETEVSSDLGIGVALPHARCRNLGAPLILFGRSDVGLRFSPESAESVHLVFLLISPLDQPEVQLAVLAQLANLLREPSSREALNQAKSAAEILSILERVRKN